MEKWKKQIEKIMKERGMDRDCHRKYPVKNLDLMCREFLFAVQKPEKITIVADYDCDGITSGAIAYMLLSHLGKTPVMRFVRRFSDGYGLNEVIIDEIDSGTVVTVDNGIVAFEAIKKAKEKGLTVLVIDHHEPKKENGQVVLPAADAVLNPKAVSSPAQFKSYCAAGLVMRVAERLVSDKDLLDKMLVFASIGTVADVVPLTQDNRRIVIDGIKAVNDGCGTVGLRILLEVLNLKGEITETDYGFGIGPVFNASGRMKDDGAKEVFDCVIIDDTARMDEALFKAMNLRSVNEMRKREVKSQLDRAETIIHENGWEDKKPIIIADKNFHEGIVGIIAGKIAEKYNTPAFVLAYQKDKRPDAPLKGSGRTSCGVDVKSLLDTAMDDLVKYGGHAGAAGLSVMENKLDKLRADLEKELAGYHFSKEEGMKADIEIPFEEMDTELAAKVRSYAPYGEGNKPLVFKVTGIRFVPFGGKFYSFMGDENEHFRMHAENGAKLVGFHISEKLTEMGIDIVKARDFDYLADAVGTVSFNRFGKSHEVQLEVSDISFYKKAKEKTDVYLDFEQLLDFC